MDRHTLARRMLLGAAGAVAAAAGLGALSPSVARAHGAGAPAGDPSIGKAHKAVGLGPVPVANGIGIGESDMAPAPDVVTEFVVGPICPRQSDLDELARQFAANLPDLPGEPGSMALCSMNETAGANVVKIGVWTDTEGFTDSQRREALAAATLLAANRTVALFTTARAISVIADALWATIDKRQGRLRLGEELDVTLGNGQIVSVVRGSYDPPALPRVNFTYTARDRLSLTSPGSSPALSNDMSTDVDVSAGGSAVSAILLAILGPLLGGIVFFTADAIASSQAPAIEGVGDALAAQWPPLILTAIQPPLPGKFVLMWSDLSVDEAGVLTLGTFLPATREPRVSIRGSTNVAIREALGHATITYRLDITDLRSPEISWSGVATGNGRTARVMFRTAGTHRVGVRIRVADALEASDEISVTTTIDELEDGQRSF